MPIIDGHNDPPMKLCGRFGYRVGDWTSIGRSCTPASLDCGPAPPPRRLRWRCELRLFDRLTGMIAGEG